MNKLFKKLDMKFENFPIENNETNIQIAKDFVLEMWQQRWLERAEENKRAFGNEIKISDMPTDLSSACKFTSLFASIVFGGKISGNYDHQFILYNGNVLDLNEDAADVAALSKPHKIDRLFIGSRDHMTSMKSCVPRVFDWLKKFDEQMSSRLNPTPSSF